MKCIYFLFSFLPLSINSISAQGYLGNPETIKGYRVNNSVSVTDFRTGKVSGYDSGEVEVYYYKDLILYKLQYILTSNVDTGKTIEIDSKLCTHYFVYHKDSSYGYDYDTRKVPVKTRISVDAAFRLEWIKHNRLFPYFNNYDQTITSSDTNAVTGIIRENYTLRNKTDGSISGFITLGYSTTIDPGIDVSICKELDSLKKKKLCYYQTKFANEELRKAGIKDTLTTTLKLEEIKIRFSDIEEYFRQLP